MRPWYFVAATLVVLAKATAASPNVLFVAVDDMNDWVGFLDGYPGEEHTPNLDRLAAQGTAFTNAHVAAPVCCPSRAAVMSGRLPTSTGIYGNQQWIKPHLPKLDTLPQTFRNHGYHAVGSGKIFHHTAGNNAPGQWDLYRRLVFTDDSWARTSPLLYPYSPHKALPKNFPFCGITLYSREVDWGTLAKPEKDYDDAQTIDFGIEFLSKKKDKPFFLACGVFHPHLPWYVPQKYLDLYPLDSIVLPEAPSDDLDDVPKPGRQLALHKSDNLKKIRDRGKWKEAVRHYLASISFADAQVGRLLNALEKSAHAKNTIVVLWSDHGWHLGEKGHWHKRTLWEEATRVPLVIAAPSHGKPGQRCSRPVSLIDLYPTLLELCRLPPKAGLDGDSLVPLLKNPQAPRRKPAIIVEAGRHVAIRDERFRYVRYGDGSEELYDHEDDPNEWSNRAKDPKLAEVKERLAQWIPKKWAKQAPTKNAYRFDPWKYEWTVKATGDVISGGSCKIIPTPRKPEK
ncbi:MAG: iduronate-2-sulfatase [Opitutae bacterium]|nr:iduronate-2-sulfatase [Opitutae bacterium]|tara:strand:+ start:1150 stop:2682 length:1533 start_codon:yes stop_codon:yes gene_type:complete